MRRCFDDKVVVEMMRCGLGRPPTSRRPTPAISPKIFSICTDHWVPTSSSFLTFNGNAILESWHLPQDETQGHTYKTPRKLSSLFAWITEVHLLFLSSEQAGPQESVGTFSTKSWHPFKTLCLFCSGLPSLHRSDPTQPSWISSFHVKYCSFNVYNSSGLNIGY